MDIWVIFALVLGAFVVFYYLCRDIKMMSLRHDKKYTLKKMLKYAQVIVGVFVAMHIVYLGVVCISSYAKYLASAGLEGFMYDSSVIVIAGLTIGLVVFVVFSSAKHFLWKLTPEEKVFETEYFAQQKQLYNSNIEKYPRLIRWFLKH